jgi:hypothetical protein
MSIWSRVDAVKLYPSGGLIYQKVPITSCLLVPIAVRQFMKDKAVCIKLSDLHLFRVALAAVLETQRKWTP